MDTYRRTEMKLHAFLTSACDKRTASQCNHFILKKIRTTGTQYTGDCKVWTGIQGKNPFASYALKTAVLTHSH